MAIDAALEARAQWSAMPYTDRAGIFLRIADLIEKKYRYILNAATMMGQSKNAWQAEIEAAALASENVRRFLADKPVRKVIVVPGKLVNVVVQG